MTTIRVPEHDWSSLEGMSTQLRARTALKDCRNAQPAVARPLQAAEMACQHLAARRRLPLQIQSGFLTHHTTYGPRTYPVAKLVREEYSKYLTAYILYSTQTDEIYPFFQMNTGYSATWYPASATPLAATTAQTRIAAQTHIIQGLPLGAGGKTDYGLVDINLAVDTTKATGASNGYVYIYSVSLFSMPMGEITI